MVPSTPTSLRERTADAWRRFYEWKTEHQFLGRYSVEKLQQFDRYQSSASLWRCLAVITVISLVPAFALIVGIHAIPVNSPDLGIKQNAAAGVRSAIGYAVLTVSWVFYIKHSLGILKECHPVKAFVLSTLAGGLLPEGLWSIVSLLWRYPTPGSTISKTIMTSGCIYFVSRFTQTKDSRTVNKQRMRAITIVVTKYLVVLTFSLLLALGFVRAPWGVQVALIVLQPPLRSLIKRRIWVHARKLSDLSTDVTLNIVDISSCMYQALCIQSAQNPALAALIMVIELFLGLAVAHTYSGHTFIVDGYRTLQTAIKIVEGSLSSTLVVEEDDIQIEESALPDENLPSLSKAVEEIATTEIQSTEPPHFAEWLQRASFHTPTNDSQQQTGSPNDLNQPATKLFSTVVDEKAHRVLSDPATRKSNLPPQLPTVKNDEQIRRISSFDTVNGTALTQLQRSHQRMASTGKGPDNVLPSCELSLSPKSVNLLRRTASDTIPDRKIDQERPRHISGHRTSTGTSSVEPRARSWARDTAKVYCFADVRPENKVAPIPQAPPQRRPSPRIRSSRGLPPLTDLQAPDGFGRLPPSRRSTSVFLTPRTLMRHGSKRLLDLGRTTGRQSGYALAGIGENPPKSDVRNPSQVNIDGMLVVRKDQARILEQTLQLLFSCEVLVVAEFVRVFVPFFQGILLATLWTLPSARYNILLRNLSEEQILEKTVWCLCFSAFELPALAMVCVTIYKKYGISPLHLLAFLLEQQYANFQTKLTSCFIALTFSTSVHQGMEWASK